MDNEPALMVVRESREHWLNDVIRDGIEPTTENCPLCAAFLEEEKVDGSPQSDRCRECPLYAFGGGCFKNGSPFVKFMLNRRDWKGTWEKTSREAAQPMLDAFDEIERRLAPPQIGHTTSELLSLNVDVIWTKMKEREALRTRNDAASASCEAAFKLREAEDALKIATAERIAAENALAEAK